MSGDTLSRRCFCLQQLATICIECTPFHGPDVRSQSGSPAVPSGIVHSNLPSGRCLSAQKRCEKGIQPWLVPVTLQVWFKRCSGLTLIQ